MNINAASSLSRKLLVAIFAVSSLVTTSVTVIQFAYNYHQEMSDVDREFALIGSTYISSLAQSVWDMNDSAIKLQLAGLQNFPNIDYVEMRASSNFSVSTGKKESSKRYFSHSFNIEKESNGRLDAIGTLEVFVNVNNIYEKLYRQLIVVFFTQLLRTLIVSVMIYIVISRSLTKHLEAIAQYLNGLSLHEKFSKLVLKRKPSDPGSTDEFDVLVHSIDQMGERIQENQKELKQLAENLRLERDEAHSANQAKSIFLANMSHELRTPMHGILSFSKFGQQKIDTATKEKLKSYFDEIHDSGTRLMSLLNNLLDLSKLESGKMTYSMHEENLISTVQTVATEMRAFAEERGLQLNLSSNKNTAIGYFDSEKIMQVVRNLISNAIKFSERGSSISIEFSETPDRVRCVVSNQGLGIPESEVESIFDKFVQSSKTKSGAGGTGLGLAISREIVIQHGGKIWAESVVDKETRFIFELPRFEVNPSQLKNTA